MKTFEFTKTAPREFAALAWFSAVELRCASLVELERGAGAEPLKNTPLFLLTCAHVAHRVCVVRGAIPSTKTKSQIRKCKLRTPINSATGKSMTCAKTSPSRHPPTTTKITPALCAPHSNGLSPMDRSYSGRMIAGTGFTSRPQNEVPSLRRGNRDAAESRGCVSLGRHDAGTKIPRNEARAQEGLGWGWWEKASGEVTTQALNHWAPSRRPPGTVACPDVQIVWP